MGSWTPWAVVRLLGAGLLREDGHLWSQCFCLRSIPILRIEPLRGWCGEGHPLRSCPTTLTHHPRSLGMITSSLLEGRKNKVFCIARHVRVARIIFVPFIALPTERTDDGVFASDFDFGVPLLSTHELPTLSVPCGVLSKFSALNFCSFGMTGTMLR